jgi:hypothetical protein
MSKKRRVGYFKEQNENKRMAREDHQRHNPEFVARREVCTPHRQGENLPHQATPERGVHFPAFVALPTNLPHQATPERGVHTPAFVALPTNLPHQATPETGVHFPAFVAFPTNLQHQATPERGVHFPAYVALPTNRAVRTRECFAQKNVYILPKKSDVQASSCRANKDRNFAPHNLQIEEDGFAALLHEDIEK